MPVAEAEQREHVLPLGAADPDLAVEPHQRVDARAAARRARAEPVRLARVGDRVAERERGAVLQRLVAVPTTPSTARGVAADVRDDARHGTPLDPPWRLTTRFERVLLDRPGQPGRGDHVGGGARLGADLVHDVAPGGGVEPSQSGA